MPRRRRGLGEVNADARAAIAAARRGNCSSALKHLYDAAPHRQGFDADKEAKDFRIASLIVSKHCTTDRGSKKRGGRGSGGRYRTTAFDGAGRRRRKRRR